MANGTGGGSHQGTESSPKKVLITPDTNDKPKGDVGSLLRMFQSEFFDAHLHMHYLFRMETRGVQDYLVNQLYRLTDEEIDFYLPQLAHVSLLRFDTSELARFLLDKAATSMHFALKIHWLVQSAVEDQTSQLMESAMQMWQESEMAMVNSALGEQEFDAFCNKPSDPHITDDEPFGNNESMFSEDGGVPTKLKKQCTNNRAFIPASSKIFRNDVEVVDTRRRTSQPHAKKKEIVLSHSKSDPNLVGTIHHQDEQSNDDDDVMATSRKNQQRRSSARHSSPPPAIGGEEPNLPKRDTTTKILHRTNTAQSNGALGSKKRLSLSNLHKRAKTNNERSAEVGMDCTAPNALIEMGDPVPEQLDTSRAKGMDDQLAHFLLKQRRCDYFNVENLFIQYLIHIGNWLLIPKKADREAKLKPILKLLNQWLFERRFAMASRDGPFTLSGVNVPLLFGQNTKIQLLRVHWAEAKVFSSKTRAPFLLITESADLDEDPQASGEQLEQMLKQRGCDPPPPRNIRNRRRTPRQCVDDEVRMRIESSLGADIIGKEKRIRTILAKLTPEQWHRIVTTEPPVTAAKKPIRPHCYECDAKTRAQEEKEKDLDPGWLDAVDPYVEGACWWCYRCEVGTKNRHRLWSELWVEKVRRIRRASPYGYLASWRLKPYIVKSGDDVRQELLAAQIIHQFRHIFLQMDLPLWLRAIEVLVTSSDSGLIEFVDDSYSIDGLKKKFSDEKGHAPKLADVFGLIFADDIYTAKKNYIESFAAYSLVTYLIQVKDRHNGNLLIDAHGHLIHIDFGFMLSNAPGAISFETAPFKLTHEYLEVMEGECAEEILELWKAAVKDDLYLSKRPIPSLDRVGYEYFCVLVVRGFMAVRKHAERIILIVRMMIEASKFPCMVAGKDAVLKSLEDRFLLKLSEQQCTDKVFDLVNLSAHNSRQELYDKYQRYFVGIY